MTCLQCLRLVGWALLAALPTVALAKTPYDNPHGDPQGCLACHDNTEPGAVVTKPIVATCRGCHPTADMHPVGVAPKTVRVPSGFPLEHGLVTCATCHTEPAHGSEAASLPSPWFRGGPYQRIDKLCFTCHLPEEYTRSNPHDPNAGYNPASPTCTACHTTLPAAGAAPEAAQLRVEPSQACSTCHEGWVHVGVQAHHGKTPILSEPLPPNMPLLQGRIACFTCHEMHQGQPAGTLTSPLANSLREQARTHDWASVPATATWPGTTSHPMLSLPLADGALCTACHTVIP